ncbi:MAG TPA: CPBP family intramembrane glutamic endopeptidase [Terriglobales bacterium]|nr:CPBP family intramembrane glutamic endopeptidase [Terriglobales bacterium]
MNFSSDDHPEHQTPADPVPVRGGGPSPVQVEQSSADSPGPGGDPEFPPVIQLADAPPADPAWNGLDVVRIVIMALVTLVVSFLAMLAVVPGPDFHARVLRLGASPTLEILAQMLAYPLLLGYMYILVTKERGNSRFWKTIHWNWPGNAWPFLGVGVAMQVVFMFVEPFLPFPQETPFEDLLRQRTAVILIAVFSVTLAPLLEELFFRGFFYPVLARRFGVGAAISVTALGFGLMHAAQYGYSWASVSLVSVVGVVLGVVRAKKDSVAAGFLVHVAYNGTIMLLLLFATDGFRHLEKLNR